ncbi:hypothetical protein DWU95_43835, partial [Burkholderia contaminans]
MNIIEPGIRNLALAKDILLTPYGLDESLLTRTIADIFTHRVDYADRYFPACLFYTTYAADAPPR